MGNVISDRKKPCVFSLHLLYLPSLKAEEVNKLLDGMTLARDLVSLNIQAMLLPKKMERSVASTE